ncbi:MAG: flagellar biosynthesis regulator FlaF [Pirellulaceae bacterium]|jgi:flagellar protein FlaF|nr:flagellar biosynthesis regulator FlaF [Pirellulaceae bacterium]
MSQSNISQAYNSSQKLGASASQTEARALLETARRMAVAKERMEDLDEYRAALRLNWRLWTIFQADVASDENPLPPGIKANILSLSVFIDKHTVGALTEPEERRLEVLININRNVAAGLMANPEGDEVPKEEAAPRAPLQPVETGDIVA